jgi:hypothetical protein
LVITLVEEGIKKGGLVEISFQWIVAVLVYVPEAGLGISWFQPE